MMTASLGVRQRSPAAPEHKGYHRPVIASTRLVRPAAGQVVRVHARGAGVVGRATAIRS
jgi:hypothetical protein